MSAENLTLEDPFGVTTYFPKKVTVNNYKLWICHWETTGYMRKQIRDLIGEYKCKDDFDKAVQMTQKKEDYWLHATGFLSDNSKYDLKV